MSTTPLSLHPGLPGLNRPGFVFTGAHLVTSAAGVKNSLAPSRLDHLLREAREAGWSVNLREANPRKLILTFDDGRRIDDEFAAVLDAHDATAIFFVCTAPQLSCYTDAAPYMELTAANRQYLLERHVIGGHTHAHTHLGRLPADEQAAVIGDGAQRFREWFGFAPRCFSYPWGAYRGATLRALRTTGVRYRVPRARGATADARLPDPARVSRHRRLGRRSRFRAPQACGSGQQRQAAASARARRGCIWRLGRSREPECGVVATPCGAPDTPYVHAPGAPIPGGGCHRGRFGARLTVQGRNHAGSPNNSAT